MRRAGSMSIALCGRSSNQIVDDLELVTCHDCLLRLNELVPVRVEPVKPKSEPKPRIIRSKFDGKCRACGGPFSVGDLIEWTPGVRGAVHVVMIPMVCGKPMSEQIRKLLEDDVAAKVRTDSPELNQAVGAGTPVAKEEAR